MIFGIYPCCEGNLFMEMPDKTPVFLPEDCPHCNKKVWHIISRVQTMTYMESDFLERFTVDTENKIIEERKDVSQEIMAEREEHLAYAQYLESAMGL